MASREVTLIVRYYLDDEDDRTAEDLRQELRDHLLSELESADVVIPGEAVRRG